MQGDLYSKLKYYNSAFSTYIETNIKLRGEGMKKVFYSLVAFALVAGFAANSHASTATPVSYDITVSFSAVEFDLNTEGSTTLAMGTVGPSQEVLSNAEGGQLRCNIFNLGWQTVDYTVAASVTAPTTPWTLGTASASNTAVLYGIFTRAVMPGEAGADYTRTLVSADFDTNDILESGAAPLQADETVLARDNTNPDPDDWDNQKGFSVPGGSEGDSKRSLRFRFLAPTADTTGEVQTIEISMGAIGLL